MTAKADASDATIAELNAKVQAADVEVAAAKERASAAEAATAAAAAQVDSLAEEKSRSEITKIREAQEAELRKIKASDESIRRRLHDDLEQTKEMKQAVIEKLMDELDALQRQLAEVQANPPATGSPAAAALNDANSQLGAIQQQMLRVLKLVFDPRACGDECERGATHFGRMVCAQRLLAGEAIPYLKGLGQQLFARYRLQIAQRVKR